MFIQQTPQGDWTALIDAGPGQGRYSSVFALIPGIVSSFLLFLLGHTNSAGQSLAFAFQVHGCPDVSY